MEQHLTEAALRIAHALGTHGSRDPIAAAEQVSILLYLKLLDEAEDASAPTSQLMVDHAEPAIFTRQAERYRWRELRRLGPDGVGDFLNCEVLPYMGSLEKERPSVAAFFREAELPSDDLGGLWQIVKEIDGLRLRDMDLDDAAEFIEELFSHIGMREVDGRFSTSPTLRRLMVTLADPQPGETVLDPAMGTAGLLVDAARHVGAPSSASIRLFGSEVSRTMLRIATVNMVFRGLPAEGLRRENPLVAEERVHAKPPACHVVLCDPPYGTARWSGRAELRFPTRSSRLEAQFLEFSMASLVPGGRAAILLPDGLLGSETAPHIELRRDLLRHFDVTAVLSIPSGRLRSQGPNSSLVVFRRPSDDRPTVDRIWYYRLNKTSRRRGALASDDRVGISGFLRHWERHLGREFSDPPGLPAQTVLEPESREPHSWWTYRSAVEDAGFRLDPSRWMPVVSDWPLNEDPAELAASAVRDYRRIADELEILARQLAT